MWGGRVNYTFVTLGLYLRVNCPLCPLLQRRWLGGMGVLLLFLFDIIYEYQNLWVGGQTFPLIFPIFNKIIAKPKANNFGKVWIFMQHQFSTKSILLFVVIQKWIIIVSIWYLIFKSKLGLVFPTHDIIFEIFWVFWGIYMHFKSIKFSFFLFNYVLISKILTHNFFLMTIINIWWNWIPKRSFLTSCYDFIYFSPPRVLLLHNNIFKYFCLTLS